MRGEKLFLDEKYLQDFISGNSITLYRKKTYNFSPLFVKVVWPQRRIKYFSNKNNVNFSRGCVHARASEMHTQSPRF